MERIVGKRLKNILSTIEVIVLMILFKIITHTKGMLTV